jgi:hypothetical protein
MVKKREREYTPEEALAITLREVTPLWYRSRPLVVGVEHGSECYPQPLDPAIRAGIWVVFLVSATSPALGRTIRALREWERRFGPLGVKFMFGFRGHYSFLARERKAVEGWLNRLELALPSFCDPDGSLSRAFGCRGEPCLSILKDGAIVHTSSGEEWLATAETMIQTALRADSPGLPLWPAFRESGEKPRSSERWSLRQGGDLAKVELSGAWEVEDDRIRTGDPKAEITVKAPGSIVDLVARSLSESGDPTRVRFDTQGASFSETFGGRDFAVDDEGNSSLMLSLPRSYSVLRGLPPTLRSIRFRFPFARVSPVALYGFEFGDA